MKAKSFFLVALLFIMAMLLYFFINPSYERSLEAKFYYETGMYEKAYKLAKEAFELDPYNKMAVTIMTQSQYALRYVRYIQNAKKYIRQIEQMLQEGEVDDKKRAKIRTIASIMVESYKKLAPSVVVDKTLIKEAKSYYEQFSRLLEKAHKF